MSWAEHVLTCLVPSQGCSRWSQGQCSIAFSNSRSQLKYGITPLWRSPGMSRGCGSTKLAQLAGKTLCYSGRELPWLSLGASTLLGIKQATVQQGWAGLLVRALSKAAALCACLSEQPRVPVWLSSTGTSCFLRLQLPSDTVKEKPPMSSPCPACAGEGRGLSHHCPRLVPYFFGQGHEGGGAYFVQSSDSSPAPALDSDSSKPSPQHPHRSRSAHQARFIHTVAFILLFLPRFGVFLEGRGGRST